MREFDPYAYETHEDPYPIYADLRAHARLEVGDAPRGEGPRHEPAHARVPRRVHGEERHGGARRGMRRRGIERDAERVREARDVVEGGEDVGVARQRREAEPLVAVDGRVRAEVRVDRVRVLVRLVGVGVELAHGPDSRRP